VTRAALLALALAACTRASEPQPRDADAPKASPMTPAGSTVALDTYPLNRLQFAHNPIEPLDLPLDAAVLQDRGVRSYRAFSATTPRVWLLVFEFERQSDLLDLAADPKPLLRGEPPFYTATAFTGPWLLVAGFPGEKPVSPQMEAARTNFLARWAGEE
jgi:hypothetical protein